MNKEELKLVDRWILEELQLSSKHISLLSIEDKKEFTKTLSFQCYLFRYNVDKLIKEINNMWLCQKIKQFLK